MKAIHFVRVNGGGPSRGYFKEMGGQWFPVQVRSKVQAKYILKMLERTYFSLDLAGVERELRQAGLPDFFTSEKQDLAEVKLAYWTMVFGEALRVMPQSMSRTLEVLRFFRHTE